MFKRKRTAERTYSEGVRYQCLKSKAELEIEYRWFMVDKIFNNDIRLLDKYNKYYETDVN